MFFFSLFFREVGKTKGEEDSHLHFSFLGRNKSEKKTQGKIKMNPIFEAARTGDLETLKTFSLEEIKTTGTLSCFFTSSHTDASKPS